MKKLKEVSWFWKDWTETEKKIYKKCAVFAVIYIAIMLLLTIACINQFHAAEIPDGYHAETVWDDGKGGWTTIIVPDKPWTGKYEIDVSGAEYIFKKVFNIIYTSLLPFASILAATLTAYNLTLMMTTKNQRKVDETYTYIKAIWKVWLYIMLTNVIITLAVQGFTEIVNSPHANPIIHP